MHNCLSLWYCNLLLYYVKLSMRCTCRQHLLAKTNSKSAGFTSTAIVVMLRRWLGRSDAAIPTRGACTQLHCHYQWQLAPGVLLFIKLNNKSLTHSLAYSTFLGSRKSKTPIRNTRGKLLTSGLRHCRHCTKLKFDM